MSMIYFQTVSGRVTTRNSATFDAKVGRFLSVNSRVVPCKTMNYKSMP